RSRMPMRSSGSAGFPGAAPASDAGGWRRSPARVRQASSQGRCSRRPSWRSRRITSRGPLSEATHTPAPSTSRPPPPLRSPPAIPYVYGPPFAFSDPQLVVFGIWGSVGGFLSVSLVLFALVGLAAGRHRGLRIALAAWLVLALSRMFGEPPGLGAILGLLPGM